MVSIVLCWLSYWFLIKTNLGLILAEQQNMPISSEVIIQNLSSDDRDLIMTSLNILEKRCDTGGRVDAIQLLNNEDDYLWFNAAQYLASIKDITSIPYLIKGLKHPAYRSHDKVVTYLKALTGKDFGKEQEKWILWWREEYPGSDFNFFYPNLEKQTLELNDYNEYLINQVVDPVRIEHIGSQIRLIGLKLKNGVSPDKAITFLKTLVLFQYVQLQFDNNSELDKRGAKRAFVYWTMRGDNQSPLIKLARKGLSAVPFEEKTLINTYLLKSGLYELDLDSIDNKEMRTLLSETVANQ